MRSFAILVDAVGFAGIDAKLAGFVVIVWLRCILFCVTIMAMCKRALFLFG